ncbi:MAG TPA: biotin/lipoyl-containing protein [Candidatus Binatia bacterium]|nr:biotin/lipoyl-containing protein [Candidatus Binatia bacterium]
MPEAGRRARFAALAGEASRTVEVTALGEGRYEVAVDGQVRVVDGRATGPASFSLLIDNVVTEVGVVARGDVWAIALGGRTHRLRLLDARALRARAGGGVDTGEREVHASMPGKVVAVLVSVGATVEAGTGLLVIEAMKMENEIASPRAGTVRELRVRPGQAVEAGELLAVVE